MPKFSNLKKKKNKEQKKKTNNKDIQIKGTEGK